MIREPHQSDANDPSSQEPPASEPVSSGDATPRWLAYARLCRIPNVFTAFADVAMGYLLVNRGGLPWEPFVALLTASGMLYSAGMVLNDVYDVAQDSKERPHRPIPSGAVSLGQARALGFGLLCFGVLTGMGAGLLGGAALPWRSAVIALLLAASILLYDAVLKHTVAGPWLMGACRFFNALLGMSLALKAHGSMAVLGYEPHQLAAAGGMGIYIAGVTWFARTEARASNRYMLGFGVSVMVAGLALLTQIPEWWPAGGRFHITPILWPFIILVLMVTPMRRCLLAVASPDPKRVQAAVKQCILSLIVLNAAIVLLTNPVGWALAVCALLGPTLVLGRWVYST